MYDVESDFERLRNEWALRAKISDSSVDMERRADQMANPHNDNYANKRKRRSDAEIISDRSYMFADEALSSQYGSRYMNWLRRVTVQDVHIRGVYRIK